MISSNQNPCGEDFLALAGIKRQSAERYWHLCQDMSLLLGFYRAPFDQGADLSAPYHAFLANRALLPPCPPTVRGRLGRWLISFQMRLLWWVVRAFHLRDNLLVALTRQCISAEQRQSEEIRSLAARVEKLEERGRGLPGRL